MTILLDELFEISAALFEEVFIGAPHEAETIESSDLFGREIGLGLPLIADPNSQLEAVLCGELLGHSGMTVLLDELFETSETLLEVIFEDVPNEAERIESSDLFG